MDQSKYILTIAIPTYNRSKNINKLLDLLYNETVNYRNSIKVIVSNNNSTDDTIDILTKYSLMWPDLNIINHAKNIGSDKNFSYCFDLCVSEYFWLIGDDDLPAIGSIKLIMDVISKNSADIIYMKSDWRDNIYDECSMREISKVTYSVVNDRLFFARLVNIWLTFISGCIVNKSKILLNNNNFKSDAYLWSTINQMSWICPALKCGDTFIIIDQKIIYASKNNTSGYSALKTFGVNLPLILKIEFENMTYLIDAIIRHMIPSFLTTLIWKSAISTRGNDNTHFNNQYWIAIKNNFNDYYIFRVLCIPTYYLPKFIGLPFVILGKIISKLNKS